eukprot:CAMPEP_0185404684 /NCGR_PEP_ID=MMETSP1364-20130426/92806_1 /TAXON_ID=38817 /ORGANISM="Gephyrocapsa oceanica, Strain RCC1303" /LENGTH=332 /DNA_ID=CAMNT_0028006983 /DNA_START=147 /DNA_END=1149 /DNA_ORIENTATION=-
MHPSAVTTARVAGATAPHRPRQQRSPTRGAPPRRRAEAPAPPQPPPPPLALPLPAPPAMPPWQPTAPAATTKRFVRRERQLAPRKAADVKLDSARKDTAGHLQLRRPPTAAAAGPAAAGRALSGRVADRHVVHGVERAAKGPHGLDEARLGRGGGGGGFRASRQVRRGEAEAVQVFGARGGLSTVPTQQRGGVSECVCVCVFLQPTTKASSDESGSSPERGGGDRASEAAAKNSLPSASLPPPGHLFAVSRLSLAPRKAADVKLDSARKDTAGHLQLRRPPTAAAAGPAAAGRALSGRVADRHVVHGVERAAKGPHGLDEARLGRGGVRWGL